MINKKYILFALLALYNQCIFSQPVIQNLHENTFSSFQYLIADGCVAAASICIGILVIKSIKARLLQKMHDMLAEKIFFIKYDYSTCDKRLIGIDLQKNPYKLEETLSLLKKSKSLLQYIFKFLLYFDYQKTQDAFNQYIDKIYIPKHIHSNETRTWIEQTDRKERQQIIELLVQFGIDLRFTKKKLHWHYRDKSMVTEACKNKDARMLRYLLETVKLNPDNWDQLTLYANPNRWSYDVDNIANPLMRACNSGSIKVVKLLTQHKTNTHPFCNVRDIHSPISLVMNTYERCKQYGNNNRSQECLQIFQCLTEYTLQKNSFYIKKFDELASLLNSTSSEKISSAIDSSINNIINACFQCNNQIWPQHPTTNGEYPQPITYYAQMEQEHKDRIKGFLLDNLPHYINPSDEVRQAIQNQAKIRKEMLIQKEQDLKNTKQQKQIRDIKEQQKILTDKLTYLSGFN